MVTVRKVDGPENVEIQEGKKGSYTQDKGIEVHAKVIVEDVSKELGRIYDGITYTTSINKFDSKITSTYNKLEVLRDDGGYILYNGIPVASLEIKSSRQDVGTAHEKVLYKPALNGTIFRRMTGLLTGNFYIGIWYGDKYVADSSELKAALETLELSGRIPVLFYKTLEDVYLDEKHIYRTIRSIAVSNINLINTKGRHNELQ